MNFEMPAVDTAPGCPLANLGRRPHLFGAIAAAVAPAAIKYGGGLLRGGKKAARAARRAAKSRAGQAVALGGVGGAAFEGGSQLIAPSPVTRIVPSGNAGVAIPIPKAAAGKRMLAEAGGLALTLPLELTAIAKPPPGYVTVVYNGERIFMLKGCARDLGLWKSRRKPPISASDWRTLAKASATAKKVDRLCKMSDKITGKKRTKTVYKKAMPARRRSS